MTERNCTIGDWTDLQFLVEVARRGTLSGAARALGVTHTTVARRMTSLEAEFGRPLMRRKNGRIEMTGTGREIVQIAKSMEEPAQRIARTKAGLNPDIAGPIRITATSAIGQFLIMPAVASMRVAYPLLEAELVLTPESLSLARREADVALRLGRPTRGELIARKLTNITYFRYASQHYLESRSSADHGFIGYLDPQDGSPEVHASKGLYGDDQVVMRTNDLLARVAAVRAGIGIGLLPRYTVRGDASLVALDRRPILVRELWLVTHRDMRNVPRVKACVEHLMRASPLQNS